MNDCKVVVSVHCVIACIGSVDGVRTANVVLSFRVTEECLVSLDSGAHAFDGCVTLLVTRTDGVYDVWIPEGESCVRESPVGVVFVCAVVEVESAGVLAQRPSVVRDDDADEDAVVSGIG